MHSVAAYMCGSCVNVAYANCPFLLQTMLLSIQELLNNPNDKSPAQREAYEEFVGNKELYRRKIKEQAARNIPSS